MCRPPGQAARPATRHGGHTYCEAATGTRITTQRRAQHHDAATGTITGSAAASTQTQIGSGPTGSPSA